MSETKTLYAKATVEKATDGEFTAIASTSSVDRHGEVVQVEGWDLKNFKNDPVILWGHDHTEPAIGKATRIWTDKTGKNPVLKFKAVISEATTRSREIKQLMEEGIIKAFSVGFRPIDAEGDTYTKQELLEISAVNVPANADAMMLAYKSLKKTGYKDSEIAEVGVPAYLIKEIGSIKEQMQIMKAQVDTAVKGLQHSASHNGRDNSVVTRRLAAVKSIARTSDELLSKSISRRKRERLVKAVKLASENLIVSHKDELNGTHKRTAR